MVLFLFSLMVVLQLLDGWTTAQVLRYGGNEENPLLETLFKDFGVNATLIVVKGAVMVGLGYLTFHDRIFDEHWTMMVILDVFYTGIVVQNFRVLKIQKAGG